MVRYRIASHGRTVTLRHKGGVGVSQLSSPEVVNAASSDGISVQPC